MQKLILVQSNYTEKLDEYLNDGWYIKDFKPVSDPPSYSESYYGRITGNIYAYVLLEKTEEIEMEKRERIPLNESKRG